MISEKAAAYILDSYARSASPAMVALYSHACDWRLTVECLHCGDGLTLADAVRVADAGYRGDDIRAARRILSNLSR